MFPTFLYFLIYVFSVLSIVLACLIMGGGGTAYFLSFSMACFGIATTLLLSAWERFDWIIISFGLFNFSLGLIHLILMVRVRKGYVVRGSFWSDQASEPLDPLKLLNPKTSMSSPERPFSLPEEASTENREPLIDVIEGENEVKIYAELPREEKDCVYLNATEGKVEIKTKNFYKMIKVPENTDMQKASSRYRNGVLEVIISKRKKQLNDMACKNIHA
jgi:HSP20 family molecular chaperone IbpA